jgi:hypothetical protein
MLHLDQMPVFGERARERGHRRGEFGTSRLHHERGPSP